MQEGMTNRKKYLRGALILFVSILFFGGFVDTAKIGFGLALLTV